MTAQIRPNRMEVSDRFPMLGFAVRTDQPDVEAEVVIASDIGLFSAQNRQSRTAANFYSSQEHGTLTVPRGEGVFVVPPDVLARFIGNEKLFFGLATGRKGNGGLHVDALPRDGSPYVSLRGFTGRTLRRGFGGARASTPKLDWTGDAPKPGSETTNGNGASASNGNGVTATPPTPGSYDDGFGPMPVIPARESGYRDTRAAPRTGVYRGIPYVAAHQLGLPRGTTAITMSSGTTAQRALDWIREKAEAVIDAVGDDVTPPSLYRLGSDSATFISAWEKVLGVASWIPGAGAMPGFLKVIPELARTSGVTLSIGPALDTPLFGGGVGVVFAPNGDVALFGQGDISIDFEGLSEFVTSLKATLQAKLKLGYNHSGLDGFASMAKVAGVSAGAEVVVGAECWLDGNGRGLGGAVSVGVGFALQLAADDRRPKHGVPFVAARSLGLPSGQTAITMSSGTTPQRALAWIREKVEAIVGAVGDDVSPPSLYRLGSDSAAFITAWETALGAASWLPGGTVYGFLKQMPAAASASGVTLSIGPALDTPLFGGGIGVVFAPDGQVALFGQGEISVDVAGLTEFVGSLKAALQAKLKLGYNNGGIDGFASLAKVASVAVGEEIVVGAEVWLDGNGHGLGGAVSIGVGFALQLAAQEAERSIVMPQLPGDARERARRIGGEFGPRIGEALDLGLDAATLMPLLDKLDLPVKAVPLGARAMSTPLWSVQWDDVYVVPQPTDNGCWATTIAMMMGWRDQMSYDPAAIAQQCGRDINNRLPWAEREDAARQLGLGTIVPQCYTPEGFRNLIERHGPLYVGKMSTATSGSGHAVLATGMYYDGSDHFVRVADPSDRAVGTPGAPGAYGGHTTGSMYIMRFDDFMREYEMAAAGTPSYVQILYAGIPAGRSINTSTSAPGGYAMAAGSQGQTGRTGRVLAKAATGIETAAAIAGVAVSIIYGSGGGDVDYYLPDWKGKKHPRDVAPAQEAAFNKAMIPIVGWPQAGGTWANCEIKWEYNGTSIANVYVRRGKSNDTVGWGVTVRGNVEDDAATYARNPQSIVVGADQVAALNVVLDYTFQAPVLTDDASARIQVKIYGDGTYEIDREWIQHSDAAFHQITEPEGHDRPRMSHLIPLT